MFQSNTEKTAYNMVYVLRSRKDSLGLAMKELARHIAQKTAQRRLHQARCAKFFQIAFTKKGLKDFKVFLMAHRMFCC